MLDCTIEQGITRMLRFRALLLSLFFLSFATAGGAAELVMFRRAGCPWCAAWDREIAPIYPQTDTGRRIGVRMFDLDRDRPPIALVSPVRYTPTFVLVAQNHEVGRIEGYPGEVFFWGLLERLAERLLRRMPRIGCNEREPHKPLRAATERKISSASAGMDIDTMIANAAHASEFLKALSHEARLVILCLLIEGERSVTEIDQMLDL